MSVEKRMTAKGLLGRNRPGRRTKAAVFLSIGAAGLLGIVAAAGSVLVLTGTSKETAATGGSSKVALAAGGGKSSNWKLRADLRTLVAAVRWLMEPDLPVTVDRTGTNRGVLGSTLAMPTNTASARPKV
jgi:hypothetical protein